MRISIHLGLTALLLSLLLAGCSSSSGDTGSTPMQLRSDAAAPAPGKADSEAASSSAAAKQAAAAQSATVKGNKQ